MAEHINTAPFVDVQDVRHSVITKPAIVHEVIVPEYTTIVQPVIHKSIVKTEVRQITQPIYEEVTRAVRIHEAELSEDVKINLAKESIVLDATLKRNESAQPKIITTYATAVTKKIMLQPIIYENVVTEIIEEIQPIIHRTVHETHIIKRQEIIHEKAHPTTSVEATVTERTVDDVAASIATFSQRSSDVATSATSVSTVSERTVVDVATTSVATSSGRTVVDVATTSVATVSGRTVDDVAVPSSAESMAGHVEKSFVSSEVSLQEMKREIEQLERKLYADGVGATL